PSSKECRKCDAGQHRQSRPCFCMGGSMGGSREANCLLKTWSDGIVGRMTGAFFLALLVLAPAGVNAGPLRVVPEGNRNAEQPSIPGASVRRTQAGKTTFDL